MYTTALSVLHVAGPLQALLREFSGVFNAKRTSLVIAWAILPSRCILENSLLPFKKELVFPCRTTLCAIPYDYTILSSLSIFSFPITNRLQLS